MCHKVLLQAHLKSLNIQYALFMSLWFMMSEFKDQVRAEISNRPVWEKINGAGFLVLGLMALVAQIFHIPVFWGIAILSMGVIFFTGGWRFEIPVYMYLGSLIVATGVAISILLVSDPAFLQTWGISSGVLSIGFLISPVMVFARFRRVFWWSLFPAAVLGGGTIVLLFTSLQWTDFIFWLGLFLGIAFILSGGYLRLLGLIIPGCLLSSLGVGTYFAFDMAIKSPVVSRVGILLVWFAVGWAVISFLSRLWCSRLIWWPLIPAGVIGIVGLGLFIGGDPDNAAFFIGNTSAVLFVAIGLYLFLIRRGMHS